MKLFTTLILTIFLSMSCSKTDTTPDQGSAPNTSAGKDGSNMGSGPASSLGSENPGH